jgi:hypothetical protein
LTPPAWAFRSGDRFVFPSRDGESITYQIVAHGVLDGVQTYLLVTVGHTPVAMRIEREERLLAMRDREAAESLPPTSGGTGAGAEGTENTDREGGCRMRTFIFLSEEGLTLQPEAVLAPQNLLGNPLVLGIASGVDQGHALLQLVRSQPSLLDTRFDEVVCLELVSAERRYLYLHDLRPADDDTETQAMFRRHLLTSEPLSAEDIRAVVGEGIAQATDFQNRGGSCYWYEPGFPDDMEG